jgi:LacI family transcriptional regulator
VQDEASQNQQSLILCDTDDLYVKAEYHANRLIENSVAGVIFVPTAASDDKNRLIVEKFEKANIPVVLADRIIPGLNIDHVTTDNFTGAYKLTEYMIKQGHKNIAIIISDLFSTERDRLEGYKQALLDNGLEINSDIIMTHNGRFAERHYLELASKLLKRRKKFTAIFAGHDRIAYLVNSVAIEKGICMPEEISIVGYDDLNPTYHHLVSLTTMHQPIYEMGKESMKLINGRIKGKFKKPQSIVLDSHLIERTSVIKN